MGAPLSLGIDAGYSSVKIVLVDAEGAILRSRYKLHRGDVAASVRELCAEVLKAPLPGEPRSCGACGSAWPLGAAAGFPTPCKEVEALIEGARRLHPEARSLIAVGGQTARYVAGFSGEPGGLRFASNGECASGTGSFFEDQTERIGFSIEDFSMLAESARSVPAIAGRCSVFAKTDIIHRQQEGVPAGDILLGLAYAMVRAFRSGVLKNESPAVPALLCGGVARNRAVVRAFPELCKLDPADFIAPEDAPFIQAAGAALIASRTGAGFDSGAFLSALRGAPAISTPGSDGFPRLEPLTRPAAFRGGAHTRTAFDQAVSYALGIDIGSTSTNLVLVDPDGKVLDYQYLRTAGDPRRVVLEALAATASRFPGLRIEAVGTTGSGRALIGALVGADAVRDEITAQAKAALVLDPEIDTIFEIGGQDSKYIRCAGGVVSDFQMNRICAAGTGSFLEEQAIKFGLDIGELGPLALTSERPVDLGERCTVFIESNVAACLSRGVPKADIAAGLCRSVVRNYLDKVVGNRAIGSRISLQGGIARNPGIVAAFESRFPGRIIVLPYFDVAGALGSALLAREAVGRGETAFKGFAPKEDAGGRRPGAESEAVAASEETAGVSARTIDTEAARFYRRTQELFLSGYTGRKRPGRKTVGVPRVLVIHKLFPMVNTFFSSLGYNVLLSDETSELTIRASQEYAQEETCYPVKLILGHVAELLEKGIDYLFLPALHTMRHPGSNLEHNYGCVYMQCAPRLVAKMMRLDERGVRLLAPTLELEMGKKYMASTMVAMARSLGASKPRAVLSMLRGGVRLNRISARIEEEGRRLVDSLPADEPCFVIVTRAYGIADPVLNMGIPEELLSRGHRVIELSHLPAHALDVSDRYPNMYWPFGQHILAGLRLVSEHPNLYAVYLTNHGCGPDTMLAHFARSEMGGKPYLAVEVDEHRSRVGVITRIEAFIRSVENHRGRGAGTFADGVNPDGRRAAVVTRLAALPRGMTVYLPRLGPYSVLAAAALRAKGIDARELEDRGNAGIERGQRLSISKEYLSATAPIGEFLLEAEAGTARKAFLVPQTEGSEADGQTARLLRLHLDEAGAREIEVVAPFLERIGSGPGIHALDRAEFHALALSGDLILGAPPADRERLLADAVKKIERCGNAAELLGRLFSAAEARAAEEADEGGALLAVGEPAVLFNPAYNRGLEKLLGDRGVRIVYAPLAEYLLFLWKDVAGDADGADAEIEAFQREAAVKGGAGSAFSPDFEALRKRADALMPVYSGANGRYRIAKSLEALPGVVGVLHVSSMYENTATIISLLAPHTARPVLDLRFDGARAAVDHTALDAFLYGLKNNDNLGERTAEGVREAESALPLCLTCSGGSDHC